MLGHASAAMTLDVYVLLALADIREAERLRREKWEAEAKEADLGKRQLKKQNSGPRKPGRRNSASCLPAVSGGSPTSRCGCARPAGVIVRGLKR